MASSNNNNNNESRYGACWPGTATPTPEELSLELGNGNVKKISLLGSTGSIGTQTLDIVEEHPDKFECVAFACGRNIELAAKQIEKFQPQMVSVQDGNDVSKLKEILKANGYNGPMPELVDGNDGMCAVAAHKDCEAVVTGIVGCAGLPPTVAAINAKKNICLAS